MRARSLSCSSRQTTQFTYEETTPAGGVKRRAWSGTGAYEIADFTGAGEARAVKEQVFDTLADTLKRLHADMEQAHGKAVADATIGARAGGVTLRKLAGAVLATDNASAALKSQTELMKLIKESVKEDMGEEWENLATVEQEKLVKVW